MKPNYSHMRIAPLVFVFCLFLSGNASAQWDIRIKKGEFRVERAGFRSAWFHVKEGNRLFIEGGTSYQKAFDEYRQAVRYNSENAALNYKTGAAALFSDNKEKASEYLLKAYSANNEVAGDILLLSGMALQYSGDFKKAAEMMNMWLDTETKKPEKMADLAKRRIDQCISAMEIIRDTLDIEITNAGENINSGSDDFSAVPTSDGMRLFFASRRAMSAGQGKSIESGSSDENILVSDYSGGKWGLAVIPGKKLKSELSETPVFLDRTDQVLYVYTGYEGEGDIKYTEFVKGKWRSLKKVSYGINSPDPETSFCISPGGDEIVFISDKGKKGRGGKDVWFVRAEGKKWSKPVNAGDSINSVFDEESARYSVTGDTLWFSSSGPESIGGFDIFYSIRDSVGRWGAAVNAGYPLNTPWDELFFVPSQAGEGEFVFVSNRNGGFGKLDIYTGRRKYPPR